MPLPGETTRSSENPRRRKSKSPAVPKSKPKQSSRRYAMWLLSRREYSASDLRKKMITRGYSSDEANDALSFVQEYQFQSDERYAGMKSRSVASRAGDRRVVATLKAKGIDEDLATSAVAELPPEIERAITATNKFSITISEFGFTREIENKIWRFLSYRGFSSQAIKQAISDLRSTENGE